MEDTGGKRAELILAAPILLVLPGDPADSFSLLHKG